MGGPLNAGYRDPGAPQGRAIPLARPNIIGIFGALSTFFGVTLGFGFGVAFGVSFALVMPMMFVALGVTLLLAGHAHSRPQFNLVLDARGVFLVNAAGVVEGMVGSPPLTLTPGDYLYRARHSAYDKQCVWLGNRFAIGTNGIGNIRWRIPVPQMPLPLYYLKGSDWEAFVAAVPQLRVLQ